MYSVFQKKLVRCLFGGVITNNVVSLVRISICILFSTGMVVQLVACPLCKQRSEIDPHVLHILSWKKKPSSTDLRRASCQLLGKEWALNTGKLPPGGLPRNSVVK